MSPNRSSTVPVRLLWALAVAVVAAACSTASEPDDASPDSTVVGSESPVGAGSTNGEPMAPSTTAPAAAVTTRPPTTTLPLGDDVPRTGPADSGVDGATSCEPEQEPNTPVTVGPTVTLGEVGRFAGGRVYADTYPVPDDLGDPWSQWGQGVVLPDGRFVSGVGDHRGLDGRSWFYEYEPAARTLTRTAEVATALGHERGDWGYGKLHAPMVLDRCDRVLTSTYWGSRRDIEFGGSYTGDHLIRYDPDTRRITSLGVPVAGHGLPSLALSPDRSTVFLEAVDPSSTPTTGRFVVANADDGSVERVERYRDHNVFRDVLVTSGGDAFVGAGNGLVGLSATGDPVEEPGAFGGESVFRSASTPSATGDIAISTRRPDEMWQRRPSGEIRSLGPNEGYVASVELSTDGSTIYYVPGAHGNGLELGTPLIALDTATGERRVVVRLNDLIEPALETRVGGSFNVVVDDRAGRVFVGLNGAEIAGSDDDEVFGTVVLAVVEFDEPVD